jgi:hypothetical protein
MVRRLVFLLLVPVLALGLTACDAPTTAECNKACTEGGSACNGVNRDDCRDGCAEHFDDEIVACVSASETCDEYLSCHHRGICERLCGDTAERCPEFGEGCSAECRETWTHETALCVDRAVNCGDLFLCVSF